jgi:hypothetical protein
VVAIAFLVVGLISSAIFGLIVLKTIRRFGLTTGNLWTFIAGAFLGILVLGNLIEGSLYTLGWPKPMSIHEENNLFYVAAVIGQLIGGTTLVWLKMRLQRMRGRNHKT